MNRDTTSEIVSNASEVFCLSNKSSKSTSCFPALGISLILKEIFKQLTTADLLRCSLVNKMWNYEARHVLREFKKCTVATRSWRPCADLLEFNALLGNVRNSPFNGLTLNIEDDDHEETDACVQADDVEQLYSFIDNKITLKYLTINWQMYDGEESFELACPAAEFLRKILFTKLKEVEELNLIDLEVFSGNQPFSSDFDVRRDCGTLPNLKVIKFAPTGTFPADLIRNLISVSPNLEEFGSGLAASSAVRYLSPDRYHILSGLKIQVFQLSEEDFCFSFALSRPLLRHLEISFPRSSSNDNNVALRFVPKWLKSLQLIFTSSEKSLETLHCDLTILMMLMETSGLPIFINVTRLKVDVDFRHEEYLLFRKFDFTKYFPKLTSISIHVVAITSTQWPLELLQHIQFRNVVELPDAASVRVKSLELSVTDYHAFENYPHFVRYSIQFSGETFPALEHLSLVLPASTPEEIIPTPYDQIWTYMPNLETIKMYVFSIKNSPNFDFNFCGVHQEEAKYLQMQTATVLKDIHITPLRPSIAYLKKLRKLELSLRGVNSVQPAVEESGGLYLSKVVGLIALNRIQNLEVILRNCNGNFEVKHGLSDFVKCLPLDPFEPVRLSWEN